MESKLSNGTIYKKVLTFSLRRLVFVVIYVLMLLGLSAGGFLITDKYLDFNGSGLVGMGIGLVIAFVLIGIISHFFMYVIKAGQIAVIMKAVTEEKIPENPWQTGKEMVKERFATVAIYYAATGIIKALFRGITNAITAVGRSVGGDSGGAVGSAIGIVINTIVEYLCDCCLAWVFYRKEQKAFKATCEGAVIFFKHGKTFFKNMGRVFGIGFLSLITIGGAFFGIFYLIIRQFPNAMHSLANELRELIADGEASKWKDILTNPAYLSIAIAALLAIFLWLMIHSTFVKPFVLVGVMRNYMDSAVQSIPEESEFNILEKNCKGFNKYKEKAAKQSL